MQINNDYRKLKISEFDKTMTTKLIAETIGSVLNATKEQQNFNMNKFAVP